MVGVFFSLVFMGVGALSGLGYLGSHWLMSRPPNWLEMMVQILSMRVIPPHLAGYLVCFVDSTAAEHALCKGYSKDEAFAKTQACF